MRKIFCRSRDHGRAGVACEIIAAIKKRDHVFLIKRFVAGIAKVGWNAREVKVNSVALGGGVDTVEIPIPWFPIN
jgi:hypothetical protein